jgi:hypothetical protein
VNVTLLYIILVTRYYNVVVADRTAFPFPNGLTDFLKNEFLFSIPRILFLPDGSNPQTPKGARASMV